MASCTIGTDVLDTAQTLLDETEQFGGAFTLHPGRLLGAPAGQQDDGNFQQADETESQPDPRVDEPEHHQYAQDDQQAAEHPHGELAEEVAERGQVPVDPLDEFAGGAGLVEVDVEAEGVPGQVGAQRVGHAPAEVSAGVGRGGSKQLPHHRRHEEDHGDAAQGGWHGS